jgi:hypothetical protein
MIAITAFINGSIPNVTAICPMERIVPIYGNHVSKDVRGLTAQSNSGLVD